MATMSNPITIANTPNHTQYFYPFDEKWEVKYYPFAASVAISDGAAVGIQISTNNVTGNLTVMGTTNANGHDFIGILQQAIASTDADYATAGKLKAVWVPVSPQSTASFAVGAGTFTAADVFKTVAFNANSLGLDVDTTGLGARIVGYTSATSGTCQFNMPTSLTS